MVVKYFDRIIIDLCRPAETFITSAKAGIIICVILKESPMLPGAYRGRILTINLNDGSTGTIDTADYAPRYLGGRGIATALYHELVSPETRALDPDNALIAMTGPLAGLPTIGGSRWGLFAKSADTSKREHFCYGNLGGTFGAELKFAGLDGLVITGKADKPVVLIISGGNGEREVRLESAEQWRGMGAESVLAAMKDSFGAKVKTFTTGPAGEAMIPFASVLAEGGASCSGGMGAVMGSKNLKAVVVRGTDRSIPAVNPDALKAIAKRIRAWDRGNVKVWGLDFMAQGPKTRKMPCYGCMANCLRVKYTASDGSAGKYMCQSRFFYMALAWAYCGKENDIAFRANRLCDEMGLDTWAVQDLVDWLVRCRDSGALSDADTGLDLKSIGSLEFVESLLSMIVERRGFGALAAQGAERAAGELGGAAEAEFRHHDPYEPRYCPVNTFLIPFEPRIPIQQLHEAGLTVAKWSSWAKGTEGAHVDTDVVRGIADRFWGGAAAADFTTLDGKANAARLIQDRQLAKECLCVCDWMYPVLDIPVKEGDGDTAVLHGIVGDPALEAEVLRAAIGGDWNEESLAELGSRVFQLQRAILLREGQRPLIDDVLPAEWHDVPLDGHVADPDCLVPGPGGETVSRLGAKIDMDDYLPARDEFYTLRGWDARSGLQVGSRLEAMGLGDIAADLAGRGLLTDKARGPSIAARIARGLRRLARSAAGKVSRRKNVGAEPMGPSLDHDEIMAILGRETGKYADERIAHNFTGWNKAMQYRFPDIDAWYLIRMADGTPQAPERLEAPMDKPEIQYEMHSAVLKAMDEGIINGMQAYRQRRLKTKAAFGDLMKLQALNKVS